MRYGTARVVTFKQEEAYRLCHHQYFGLRMEEAAAILGISMRTLRWRLECLRKTAPQLFPILRPNVFKQYNMFMEGYTVTEIAECLNISTRAVFAVLSYLHKHRRSTGVYFRSDAGRKLRYHAWMDSYIVSIM
jgi:hypothetical protein